MSKRNTLVFITAISAALSASMAMACESSNMGTVDAIDGTFPMGGGTLITSLASSTDEAWMRFYATGGDAITVNYSEVGANANLVSGILLEVNNSDVAVGDILNVNNWNINNQGAGGPDLVVQSTNNIASVCGPPGNQWGNTCGPGTQSFTILDTGWHAIGTALCNSSGASGTITITLSGNTGVPHVIPTLSTAAMLVLAALLALLGMAFVGRGRGFPGQLN